MSDNLEAVGDSSPQVSIAHNQVPSSSSSRSNVALRRSIHQHNLRSLHLFLDVLIRSEGTVVFGVCYWLPLSVIQCVPVNFARENRLSLTQGVIVDRHKGQVYFAIGIDCVHPPLVADPRFRLDDVESWPDVIKDRMRMANAAPNVLPASVEQNPLNRPILSSSPVPLNLSQPETLSPVRSSSETSAVEFTSWYGADLTAWPIQMRQ
jgi:hypothetical protein